eukprot:5944946-Pyramimonas_sp.AAC.1
MLVRPVRLPVVRRRDAGAAGALSARARSFGEADQESAIRRRPDIHHHHQHRHHHPHHHHHHRDQHA